jgi:hypothetical protein
MFAAISLYVQEFSPVHNGAYRPINHWPPLADMMLTGFSTYLHDTIVAVDSDIHQIRRFCKKTQAIGWIGEKPAGTVYAQITHYPWHTS